MDDPFPIASSDEPTDTHAPPIPDEATGIEGGQRLDEWVAPEEPPGLYDDEDVSYGDIEDRPTGEWAVPPPKDAFYPSAAIATKESSGRRWPMFLGAFAAAFLGALLAVGGLALVGLLETSATPTTVAATPTTVIERVTTEIVTQAPPVETAEAVGLKVFPSIVTVEIQELVNGTCVPTGSGSGVVLDDQGHIATNDHVVTGADCVQVVFQDGRIYDAEVLGSDSLTDLAVIRIDAADLDPIDIGTSGDLAIGQTTVAVGNPLGQEGGASLTVGVLSAKDRQVDFSDGTVLFGMLQTDAPITQGSSGGALVDIDGRLIGITSAIGISDAGAEGIGYAIPIEMVQRITDEIIETGDVRHAFLGIEGETFFENRADGAQAPAGATVNVVVADTTASEIGLVEGDVIIAVDTTEIMTMDDLVNSLRLYRVGEQVRFRIVHDSEIIEVTAPLGERPEDEGG